ncbi:hypothetical protein VIBNIFTn2_1110009 [Vibrio nigripulchritudo FTn2]|uniref:hypothetical protein n=1 Tax=Vibrio nigripulchritudo TaxID=28173 RepID=UPI0003B1EE35|nr:hypothetical protein [Vibrio nigripulchritudo]BCL74200.1 hypothetical protein VNTUMSATTG_61370 [Vibrio nigripulchritudo]CCN39711.1 hypothetical protein VIBNIFTn2_1110009 [Vibrio nigripulchritudo FTn2]
MTAEEYKAARKVLDLSVSKWIEKLGISMDTHKSYNSGRALIQTPVANHIETLMELKKIQESVSNTLK